MLMLALLAAAAGPTDGKTMAQDDWHSLAIYGVGAQANGPLYLQAHAGDLDGDGLPDDAVLKLQCDGSQLRSAQYVVAARETSSGMPTGKRMHKPIVIVKEWGSATPQLMATKPTYDVKKLKGNERVAADGWTELSLANADGLCGAAQAAATTVVKSKSNITNN
jgi:hypothetical protein